MICAVQKMGWPRRAKSQLGPRKQNKESQPPNQTTAGLRPACALPVVRGLGSDPGAVGGAWAWAWAGVGGGSFIPPPPLWGGHQGPEGRSWPRRAVQLNNATQQDIWGDGFVANPPRGIHFHKKKTHSRSPFEKIIHTHFGSVRLGPVSPATGLTEMAENPNP